MSPSTRYESQQEVFHHIRISSLDSLNDEREVICKKDQEIKDNLILI